MWPGRGCSAGGGGPRSAGVDGGEHGRPGHEMGWVTLQSIFIAKGERNRRLASTGVKECFYLFIFKPGEGPVCLVAENDPERGKLMLEQLGGRGWGERRGVGQAMPRWRGSLGGSSCLEGPEAGGVWRVGARRIGGVFSVKREASVGVRRDTHLLCQAWLRLASSAGCLPSSGPAPRAWLGLGPGAACPGRVCVFVCMCWGQVGVPAQVRNRPGCWVCDLQRGWRLQTHGQGSRVVWARSRADGKLLEDWNWGLGVCLHTTADFPSVSCTRLPVTQTQLPLLPTCGPAPRDRSGGCG